MWSCEQDEIEYKGVSRSYNIYLESDRGTCELTFQTNAPWTATVQQSTSWACLQDVSGNALRSISGDSDGSVMLFRTRNTAFNRFGIILVSFANSTVVDTLFLKQYGETTPMFEFKDSLQIIVNAEGGNTTAKMETNLTTNLSEQMAVEIDYAGENEEWINNLKINNLQSVSFFVKRNATGVRRSAIIRVMFTDEFDGKRQLSACKIVQNP
jgi:hypothetical protein